MPEEHRDHQAESSCRSFCFPGPFWRHFIFMRGRAPAAACTCILICTMTTMTTRWVHALARRAMHSHNDSRNRFAAKGRHQMRGGSLFDVAGSPVVQSISSDFRPKRIILVRHGESLGNVDDSAYVTTPDWRVGLTERGLQQASDAGVELRDMIGDAGQAFFYYSPYKRTTQTLERICEHLDDKQIIAVREEPRISELQFGNFQNVEEVLRCKEERHKFGRFYYRFKSGESGLDVYSRVSSFITTLVRDCHQYSQAGHDLSRMNVVIVTHGLALRLFLMRWFQFSVEIFEQSSNPDNCQLIIMRKHTGKNGHKWYELDASDRESLSLPECCGVPQNVHLHKLSRGATYDEPSF